MNISFTSLKAPSDGAVVVLVDRGAELAGSAADLDEQSAGALSKAVASSRFDGRTGEVLEVLAPANLTISRVLMVGLGKPGERTHHVYERVGAAAVTRLLASGEEKVAAMVDRLEGCPVAGSDAALAIASGMRLKSYRFDRYRTKEPEHKRPSLKEVTIATRSVKRAGAQWEKADKVIDGVFLTRDLVSEPANILYPASFADEIRKLEDLGLDVEVLREKQLESIGMGALLAVGQGSDHESHVVIMRWSGSPKGKKEQPIAFVGKGVTFDTGGISIKPAAGMEEMKWDMGGAGIVTGTMAALAGRKAKVNAVGIVGLVENMPSGGAQRPGDIVTSMSGQTIEVLNTDAEGRMVLADILWYCQKEIKPKFMIDLATLTGAMIISLGRGQYAGYFSNDDKLSANIDVAGAKSGDLVWRMPLSAEYDRQINTPSADMKNIGGRGAGSITAAQFLQRFTNDVPWAHIDVAGVVWTLKDGKLWEKGATGYGVRLLNQLVADKYEAR